MLTTLFAIWLLHLAALVTPGANALLVSQLAASDRTRSALFAALGVTAGAAMWSSAAVLGVNAVFEAFPRFRIALQVAGAIYLLYLATRLWRSPATPDTDQSRSMSASAAFRLGLLTNATNPKSALFFGSIFSASLPAQPIVAMERGGDGRCQCAVLARTACFPVLAPTRSLSLLVQAALAESRGRIFGRGAWLGPSVYLYPGGQA